jgi:superfamily II DNA or RNA helicase
MNGQSLRDLNSCKPRYHRPRDPVAEEVLIPALERAEDFRCMVGYFGSGALRELAPGLASYIFNSERPLRLLVSPQISPQDQEALELGLKRVEEVVGQTLEDLFGGETGLTDELARHTKRCLAYLIGCGRLEMKVVVVEGGIFHLKEWIATQGEDTLVLAGSANFTGAALKGNHEVLHLHRSWRGEDNELACQESVQQFEEYWKGESDSSTTLNLPQAVEGRILHGEDTSRPPTVADYQRAVDATRILPPPLPAEVRDISVPEWINYEEGDFKHQGDAVEAWESANRSGVLAIATGGGKTIASLVAAARLRTEVDKLLVVIAVPTKPLFAQWCDEIRDFGLEAPFKADSAKKTKLQRTRAVVQDLYLEISRTEAIVATIDLLCDGEFQSVLQEFNIPTLLIADEVHHFGTSQFLNNAPDWIEYRLGLSATPVRQYDEEGTEALFEYFLGGTVFEFGMQDAIGKCLTPYDYYLHPVELSQDEVEQWLALSARISRHAARCGDNPSEEDKTTLQTLLNARRTIIETAQAKLLVLRDLLSGKSSDELQHSLIYVTGKAPQQIKDIHDVLSELGHLYHQVTEKETANRRLLADTITAFRSGTLSFLTAKRVLDEGFNVPEIRRAFILASTTTSMQWIQRRGRVLRKCEGKTHADIHDFLVLPPSEGQVDSGTKKIVKGELARCDEFSSLSRNRDSANGPESVLNDARIRFA